MDTIAITLIARYLNIPNRAKCRYLISDEWNWMWEDWDSKLENDVKRNNHLLKIMKCDACKWWRKYNNISHLFCETCNIAMCKFCAKKSYERDTCINCDDSWNWVRTKTLTYYMGP